jgi:hypothetical protein
VQVHRPSAPSRNQSFQLQQVYCAHSRALHRRSTNLSMDRYPSRASSHDGLWAVSGLNLDTAEPAQLTDSVEKVASP